MKQLFLFSLILETVFLLDTQMALAVFHIDRGVSFVKNQGACRQVWSNKLSYMAGCVFNCEIEGHLDIALSAAAFGEPLGSNQPYFVANRLTVKGATQIEVLDLTGKTLVKVTDSETVDLASLKKGIYLVSAVVNGQTSVAKIVKK